MEIRKKLKDNFVFGLLLILPIFLVAVILVYIYNSLTTALSFFQIPITNPYLEVIVKLVLVIVLITIVGIIFSSRLMRPLVIMIEARILKIPFLKGVYITFKQVSDTITLDKEKVGRPIMIEYPRKGVWQIAFKTGTTMLNNKKYVSVFVPTGLLPLPTGFLVHVDESEITYLKMSTKEAFKIIISSGIVKGDFSEEAIEKQLKDDLLEKDRSNDLLKKGRSKEEEKEEKDQNEIFKKL